MRIAVMGAGGVGGFFGGVLAHTGYDVVFIARGSHLRAIRARGLRIERVAGDPIIVAPADATSEPTEVGPVDLVLLAVKTYDLAEAIDQLCPLIGAHTTVLTLQNGVEAPALVAQAYGPAYVLPGLAYCEVAVKEPGIIVQGTPLARLVFGEHDGQLSERGRMIAGLFSRAGVDVTLSTNVHSALWSKFCFICAMSGVTALARQPLGPILADDEARWLLQTAMEEIRNVAYAHGVRFDADPVEQAMATAARFQPESKSSMLRDLERGRRLEVEALNGAAVRLGRSAGVATPANQAIYAALRLAQPTS